jgi:hypothetical protein
LRNFKHGLGDRIKLGPVVGAIQPTGRNMAAPARIAPRSAPPISINYAPVINGAGLEERHLLSMLERHAYELYRIIRRQQERDERLAFT